MYIRTLSFFYEIGLLTLLLASTPQLLADTHQAASCSAADILAAQKLATHGDTIIVPAGNCTWSYPTACAWLDWNNLTFQGAGIDQTVITIDSNSGAYNGILVFYAKNITVKGFTFQGCSGCSNKYAIKVWDNVGTDFRITGNKFTGVMSSVIYVGSTYGVIDNNEFVGAAGNEEMIFVRGPADSWQTNSSMGGANNVFVENNTFSGDGYVSDCNSNSRCVFRYNTIAGRNKIDTHGKCTNTPNRSARHYEIYNNEWLNVGGGYRAMELRGGTGHVFNNVGAATGSYLTLTLRDYAFDQSICYGYKPLCACPSNYPLDDQIGVGKDPKVAASEPMYLWNNKLNGSSWVIDQPVPGTTCISQCGNFTAIQIVQPGRDYFVSDTKPASLSGYLPYTCPHPLVGSGSCSDGQPGRSGYVLGSTKPSAPGNLRLVP